MNAVILINTTKFPTTNFLTTKFPDLLIRRNFLRRNFWRRNFWRRNFRLPAKYNPSSSTFFLGRVCGEGGLFCQKRRPTAGVFSWFLSSPVPGQRTTWGASSCPATSLGRRWGSPGKKLPRRAGRAILLHRCPRRFCWWCKTGASRMTWPRICCDLIEYRTGFSRRF